MTKFVGALEVDDQGLPVVSSMGEVRLEPGDKLVVWRRRSSETVFDGVVDLVDGVQRNVTAKDWGEWLSGAFEAELEKRAHLKVVT